MSERQSSSLAKLVGGAVKATVAVAGVTVGAVAVSNAVISGRTPQLSPRLGGQFGRYPARFGDVSYTVAGTGSPVLLLHGLDAGRSMAEWRGLFDLLADEHTVYAFDWLGWGLSDAAQNGYDHTGFAEIVRDFIHDIIQKPTMVVAAGQGAIFAVLAASGNPEISGLALICPVPPAHDQPSGQSRAEAMMGGALLGGVLNAPLFGTAAVNWLRSRAQLAAWATEHGFTNPERAEQEVNTLYVSAHQDPAGYGLRAFLQGNFEGDWRDAWSRLEIPALLIWGRDALREGFDSSPEWLALQPRATLEVVENTRLLPHLEAPASVASLLGSWLNSAPE